MRPSTGSDSTIYRPRKHSDPTDRPHLTPTTFFLTRDPDARIISPVPSSAEPDISPVRTLKETLDEADRQLLQHTPQRNRQQEAGTINRRRSTIKPHSTDDFRNDCSPQCLTLASQLPSGALSPSVPTSQEPSLPSSPKSSSSHSFAKSDDDELTPDENASQAIASSEDEDEDGNSTPPEVQDSAPQLIMPSIKMPSRRPFTNRGKQIGQFKLLVAGSPGSGRTSLIKSIVQLCEDIVHVDPISSVSKPVAKRNSTSKATSRMVEIYASTKPYPFWWSELDESRVLKRRKSVGDAVLERNICFVDTSHAGRPDRVIHYLEQQLAQSMNIVSQARNELTGLLSGRGGVQVDVVLYLLTKDTLKEDCNAIQRMSQLCNVIPLISKADLLTPELITELKGADLPTNPLPHLPFNSATEQEPKAWAPYSVSSANGSDFDNMDASLLMSSEYVQPLVPSELMLLIEQIFDPSTLSYLRYTSAKRLVSWYATEPRLAQLSSPSAQSSPPSTLNSPLPTSLTHSGVLIPVTSELSLNTSNSYALAKVADHTYREEHLAQIRLSKWASDLQLSLQRERERYECLAQSERALWLVQRMGEEIRDGQVIPLQNRQAMVKSQEQFGLLYPDLRYETHDPLGLLQWQDMVKTKSWAALQVVGSFGVVGGVALWLAKTWGLTASLHDWAQNWTVYLFGNLGASD